MATLKLTRGTSFSIGYTHQFDGVTSPLTGCTLYFTVKGNESDNDTDDSTAYITKTLTDGDFTDAANGYTRIDLDDTDTTYQQGTTTLLTPNSARTSKIKYYYDIRVKESDGHTYKRDEGTVIIDGSPTNRNV